MNKPVFYIIFLFCFSKFIAQENLVPNGSFEDTIFCPTGTGNILSLKDWYSANSATPDYYNACDQTYGSSVPDNDWGYQFPQDGNGYIGLILYGAGLFTQSYREYAQVKLTKPLIHGEYYCWSSYLSLLDEAGFASNNFGIAFSEDSITDFSDETLIPLTASLNYHEINLDKEGWVQLEFLYQANGNEKYLTLGNFFQNSDTDSILLDINAIGGRFSYYFIDNVTLTKCEFNLNIPNVFSPNGDGMNDILAFQSLSEGITVTILNRWGQEVFFTSKPNLEFWDGKSDGQICQEGTYFYTLKDKNLKKTGFIQLIR